MNRKIMILIIGLALFFTTLSAEKSKILLYRMHLAMR